MFEQVRRFFSSLWSRDSERRDIEGIQLDLHELFNDLREQILLNEVRLAENEDLITRVENSSKEEEEKVRQAETDFERRSALRKVRSLRKRIERLTGCSRIYHDNINMQTALAERLEDMRVSGLKTISADVLEEMELDYQEMYNKHRDIMGSIDAMMGDYGTLRDDPDLDDLAKEFGV